MSTRVKKLKSSQIQKQSPLITFEKGVKTTQEGSQIQYSWITFQDMKEIKYLEEYLDNCDVEEQQKQQIGIEYEKVEKRKKEFLTLNEVVCNLQARIHKYGDIEQKQTIDNDSDNSYDKKDPFINDEYVATRLPQVSVEASYQDYLCFDQEQILNYIEELKEKRLELNSEFDPIQKPQKDPQINANSQKHKKFRKFLVQKK